MIIANITILIELTTAILQIQTYDGIFVQIILFLSIISYDFYGIGDNITIPIFRC